VSWWGQTRRTEERVPHLLRHVAQGCAAITIVAALVALGGWATGRLILAGRWHGFAPMRPGAALFFLLLGAALLIGCGHPRPRRAVWLSYAGATFVLVVGLLVLTRQLTGVDLGVEHWLFRGARMLGQTPVVRISSLGVGAFVMASLSLLVVLGAPARWRSAHDLASSTAAGLVAFGALVLLGYWGHTAFAFERDMLPIALPSAIVWVFLGAGLLAGTRSPVLTGRAAASLAVGLGVGLLASVALFVLVHRQVESRVQGEFDRKAEVLALAFRSSVKDTVEELRNVGALFTLSDRVDRRGFRTFVSQILERQPSVRAFAWSPLIAERERAGVEATVRREGFPDFRVMERVSDGQGVPADRRTEYAPVVYVEPLESRRAALGFDALSDPVRRAALEKARDTGRAVATELTTPAAGARTDRGIVIFQPVYRASASTANVTPRRDAVRGFVVETVDLDDLIRRALPDPEREGVEFRLVDASTRLRDTTILASAGAEVAAGNAPRFATWITVVDRSWRLELYAGARYLAGKQGERAWIVLGSGLLMTVLLSAYLLGSTRHAAEAEALAEGLRKVSRALEQSPASVVITDTQGTIEYINPKCTEVSGYSMGEARGQTPRIFKSGETNEATYRDLWTTISAGREWRGEFHNRKKSGDLFWETVSISPVRSSDGRITHYVAVKEDITEGKRMEETARVRTHQLEVIRSVTAEITRELDLYALLTLIVQRATALAGAASGGIYLWDEPSHVLVPHAYHGLGQLRERFPRRLGEGLVGSVAQWRRGAIVNDYRSSPLAHQRTLDTTEITAVLAEPLVYRDRLLGVLAVHHEHGARTFGEADQDVLRLFAAQAAIAIENARLFRQEHEGRAQLEAVRAVSAEITQELDLAKALRLVAQRACALTGAAAADIDLWDKDRQLLVPNTSYGHTAPRPTTTRRLGEGVMGTVAETRRGLIINDYRSNPIAHPDTLAHTTITASLVEPLLYRDTLLGVIGVDHETPGRTFSPQDQDLLRLFAAQAAIAIENARLHEQIKDHAATLERQIQERTQDLEFALRLAEAASRAKAEFLTNMSHELRTPLNGILGFSDLMLRQGQALPREKQERFLSNIHTSGQRLLELVSQLLDFTRARGGGLGLDRRPLPPAAALDEVLAEVRPITAKKGLGLRIEMAGDLPCVYADPVRFRQICFNLLTNAVKFTPVGGTISVTARTVRGHLDELADRQAGTESCDPTGGAASSSPEWLQLSVADTGIGIRSADLPRLFEQFAQLESAYTKRHAGSGIGLALTRQLVELHGGRIWAESAGEGKGSTFRVVIPCADSGETHDTATGVDGESPHEVGHTTGARQ
jgi:PAS domain S-box-containing protein